MIDDILDSYGTKLVDSIKENLRTRGYNGGGIKASGELENRSNLYFEIKLFTDKYVLRLNILDYYKWVDEGRKPGKQPPPEDILKWVRSPIISNSLATSSIKDRVTSKAGKPGYSLKESKIKSLAYLIGRKIGREGTKPTYFLTDAFEDIIPQLTKAIEKDIAKDIVITIKAA